MTTQKSKSTFERKLNAKSNIKPFLKENKNSVLNLKIRSIFFLKSFILEFLSFLIMNLLVVVVLVVVMVMVKVKRMRGIQVMVNIAAIKLEHTKLCFSIDVYAKFFDLVKT